MNELAPVFQIAVGTPDFMACDSHMMVAPNFDAENLDDLNEDQEALLFAASIRLREGLRNTGIIVNNGVSARQTISHLHLHVVHYDEVYDKQGDFFMPSYRATLAPKDLRGHEDTRRIFAKSGSYNAWFETKSAAGSRGHIVIPSRHETPELYMAARSMRGLLKHYYSISSMGDLNEQVSGFTYVFESNELHILPWRNNAPAPHSATNAMRVLNGRRDSFVGKGWTEMQFKPGDM
ncbi:MAG TPA: HIT domain-containing protein [Alphaproteobacteria bacterium]